MAGHRPVMADFNIDFTTFLFRALSMVPFVKILTALKAGHIAPTVCKIGLDLRGNGFGLSLPELVSVSEHAMLAEQVGGDLSVIMLKIKERLVSRNRRAACHPCLAVASARGVLVLALIEAQPFGLLLVGGKRQGADGLAVYLILHRMQRIEDLMREAEGIGYKVEEIEREYEDIYPETYGETPPENEVLVEQARTRWKQSRTAYRESLQVTAAVVSTARADTGYAATIMSSIVCSALQN